MTRVGLLGCGTVGTGVVRLVAGRKSLSITRIAVRDTAAARDDVVDRELLTTDADAVVADADVDVVVELIGGVDRARELVLAALGAGKPVVTANKALLATSGPEIFAAAEAAGVGVYYEASVGGGIPILRSLREGLAANRIDGMYGIVNGTSNYILTEMAQRGVDFGAVLAEAQAKGYAEADPTLDVDGTDAAQKLSVLVATAYGRMVGEGDIFTEGIEHVTPLDLSYGQELGYVLRPLAIATRAGDEITLRVHPTWVPRAHLLADVGGVFNAVYVEGDPVGPTLHFGRGAGAGPTASAVVGDLLEAARGGPVVGMAGGGETLSVGTFEDARGEYYLRFAAWDRPGVLSKITGVLGGNGISIAQLLQREHDPDQSVPVVVLTHEAREGDVRAAVGAIDAAQDVVSAKTTLIRVMGEGA